MAWLDQRYIEALSYQLKSFHERNPGNDRSRQIFVVHNFMSTVQEVSFSICRELLCREHDHVAALTVDKQQREVECYENSTGDMVHFFLARDPTIERDSPAGLFHNEPTITHLRNLLKRWYCPREDPSSLAAL